MKKFFIILLLVILTTVLSACSEKVSYVESDDNLIKEIEIVPIEVIPIEVKGL